MEKRSQLTHTEFHILFVLSKGENHGYAIMKFLDENPDIVFSVGPATLYRTIRKMLQKELIEEVEDRPDPDHDDERRRYYRLTGVGLSILSEETKRLFKLISLARDSGIAISAG
jgi:DNA-binding PadR family transcriptional regulator